MNFGWGNLNFNENKIQYFHLFKEWRIFRIIIYMMAQISIHNNDEISIGMFDSVYVCCAQAKFCLSRSQQNFIIPINWLQLLCYIERSIGTTIINNNDFIVEFAVSHISNEKRTIIIIYVIRGTRCKYINNITFRPYISRVTKRLSANYHVHCKLAAKLSIYLP